MLSLKVKEGLVNLTPNKKGYVFLTNRGGTYTPRTIQKIIESAASKAGIRKKVTPHTLRHSFATHLLENGIDIRYIKDLLGHSEIRTTLIYTKVSNKNFLSIKSPLDD
ncbi:MAG: tyrosine-type recombinase/integrase [Candidatus Woesearchaeota archaeon]